ncbi:MAG TPA: hydantoinase B/oxoprolinase family protein [Alphaproteobacteria bacterium]
MNSMASGWQFWIDRGGTFTDIVAKRPDGAILTHKLLSENPERYRDAAIQGIRELLGLPSGAPLTDAPIEAVKMGTTVATNALLERKGERVVLAITRGFADQLRIAYQNRPKLFTRRIILPELLYERVVEIAERMSAQGEVLTPLETESARRELQRAYDDGIRAVAIVLLHGYRYPQHELMLAEIAREIGFTQISVSHQVSPLMKIVGRGDTTVVDAYVSPILRRYVDRVSGEIRGGTADGEGPRLMFMQSNGGLVDARFFQGKDSILSGPAGGIVGAVRTATMAGFDRIITFDMGGTSTDVALYNGEYERAFETLVAGVRMRAPMMKIHTVAAGGGSILFFDGARFRVGPESAGANPGPACYRRGGPLCVTDANVMVGKIQPAFFPKVFGPNGDQPLDADIVRAKFEALAEDVAKATGERRTPEEIADGFLKIAVENMANAIKQISVQRGFDVTEYALCTFGGAGGQHACRVADALGMTTVFVHPLAGVLSAYGMGLADLRVMREKAVEAVLDDALMPTLEADLATLGRDGMDEMRRQGIPDDHIEVQRKLHLKYEGTDSTLVVDHGTRAEVAEAFAAAHRQRYGFTMPGKRIIVEAVAVEVVGRTETANDPVLPLAKESEPPAPRARIAMYAEGESHDTPVYDRDGLKPGMIVTGPAVIAEKNATTIVEPGWRAEVTPRNHLVLKRVVPLARKVAVGTQVDPVMLEVFNNLFMSIAEQMGVALQNTAYSVNIKERLDFSCALFDRDGQLIANAPHMPVHLGSMGESVAAVKRARGDTMRPGDVYVLNAPYNGGTHLPDVTVVTPVFDEAGKEILFFVASRGHHADIGGLTPGSMPPDSTTVEEEGVLIDNFLLVEQGRFREAEMLELLRSGKYPARNPAQNIADLKAQVAACEKGVQELRKMVAHFGLDVVRAYMQHVQDNAEEQVRRVLDVLKDGSFAYEMDDGSVIKVKISIDKAARTAVIDFTGTSPQRPTNFNAPAAVCMAAVLYVFRTLVEDEIPMNAGVLKPLKVIIPDGCMLKPRYPAAVVAGNVETSQVVTDTLYGALGVLAGAQGTMNNFTFGNERHQYYETVCGGSGAGPDFDGTDAVHTHMTNSRLTDPEVLEWRFPVLVESFRIRRGSGGRGLHRGGDGVVRRIRFREKMTAAILANRRRVPPFGLAGGEPGAVGRNWVERTDGTRIELAATGKAELEPGDVFVIETPGGGGYGNALARAAE